jgi:hypothetical protein
MTLLLFLFAHAKDAGLKVVAIFIVAVLLAGFLSAPGVYEIDPSSGFVRSVLNGLVEGSLAVSTIFTFILVYTLIAAMALVSATQRALWAIDAGTLDQGIESRGGEFPLSYLFVLVMAIANGPFYCAGMFARQWFISPSLFGHLLAYLTYTALIFVSVGEIAVRLKIRSRWKNRMAVT